MSKILFLDFDGVLNSKSWTPPPEVDPTLVLVPTHEQSLAMLDPVRCARVQTLCTATGASIVFVTGWRRWASPDELTRLLRERGITAPTLGAVGGVKMSWDIRSYGAKCWLEEHPEVTSHLVIDDVKDYWKGWKGSTIHPDDGIEDSHVAQAIEILNRA